MMNKNTLYHLEDDSSYQITIENMVSKKFRGKIKYVWTTNRDEILDVAHQDFSSVFCLDINIDGDERYGLETVEQIRAVNKDSMIIMHSSYKNHKKEAKELGADLFFTKRVRSEKADLETIESILSFNYSTPHIEESNLDVQTQEITLINVQKKVVENLKKYIEIPMVIVEKDADNLENNDNGLTPFFAITQFLNGKNEQKSLNNIKQIKSKYKNTPLLVISTEDNFGTKVLKAGADIPLAKDPIRKDENYQNIQGIINFFHRRVYAQLKHSQQSHVEQSKEIIPPLPLETIISYKISGKVEAFNNDRVLLFLSKQLLNRENIDNTQDWVIGDFLFEINCKQTQGNKVKTNLQAGSVDNALQSKVIFGNNKTLQQLNLSYKGDTYQWNFETRKAILDNFTTFSASSRFPKFKTILRTFTAHRMIDFLVETQDINSDDSKIITQLRRWMPYELFKILIYRYNAREIDANTLNELIKLLEKETEITFKYLYEGQINDIDKERDTAFVSMINLKDKNKSFSKSFIYSMLEKRMILRKRSRFLYLQYEDIEDEPHIDIEPIGTPKTFF